MSTPMGRWAAAHSTQQVPVTSGEKVPLKTAQTLCGNQRFLAGIPAMDVRRVSSGEREQTESEPHGSDHDMVAVLIRP